jgi:hypothetical protein
MIKKTTTFALGIIFSIGLCTSVSLEASFFSRSNAGADIIAILHDGFKGILANQTSADVVIKKLKKSDHEIGNLIEKLLEFLLIEFKKDSTLIHDKKRSGKIVEEFCIKHFIKLGAIKSIQYKGILERLKNEFSVYTPEDFYTVICTLHTLPDIDEETKAMLGAVHSLEIQKR